MLITGLIANYKMKYTLIPIHVIRALNSYNKH